VIRSVSGVKTICIAPKYQPE